MTRATIRMFMNTCIDSLVQFANVQPSHAPNDDRPRSQAPATAVSTIRTGTASTAFAAFAAASAPRGPASGTRIPAAPAPAAAATASWVGLIRVQDAPMPSPIHRRAKMKEIAALIDRDRAWQFGWAALANRHELLEASRLFCEAGRFGPARSLAISAREECGKSATLLARTKHRSITLAKRV